MDISSIRLTETVAKGGCAAKLPAGQLRAFLAHLELPKPPELVVGTETLDDACLWDLQDGRYMVQTVDFFTPIVDDPYDFGAIAAANALSDVFAMGGRPKTALTILGFPAASLPLELMTPLMKGAVTTIAAAGACLAGGHTIDDETLKLGFAVTGFVDKRKAWTNAGARPGDRLILTKGLGTGTITSALKSKKADSAWVMGAVASMKQLNDVIAALDSFSIHAATDITGFGLAGHSLQMAQASRVSFSIHCQALPVLTGAHECIEKGILNRAHHSNAQYVKNEVAYLDVPEAWRWLTVDPQTSGGLLLSVASADAGAILTKLTKDFPLAACIGEVLPEEANTGGRVVFTIT